MQLPRPYVFPPSGTAATLLHVPRNPGLVGASILAQAGIFGPDQPLRLTHTTLDRIRY